MISVFHLLSNSMCSCAGKGCKRRILVCKKRIRREKNGEKCIRGQKCTI